MTTWRLFGALWLKGCWRWVLGTSAPVAGFVTTSVATSTPVFIDLIISQ